LYPCDPNLQLTAEMPCGVKHFTRGGNHRPRPHPRNQISRYGRRFDSIEDLHSSIEVRNLPVCKRNVEPVLALDHN